MAKIEKKMSVTGSDQKPYKDLKFLGYEFKSLEECLEHPDCVGETDIPEMTAKQFSVLGRVNYATDLQERARVRPVWKARIEGPTKAFVTGAKALIKVFQSISKNLSMDEALKMVYKESGVDPNAATSIDLITPVDVDAIGEDVEAESNDE